MKRTLRTLAFMAASSVLLAACGGSGGGSAGNALPLPDPNIPQARTLTGSSAPVETGAEQRRRGLEIHGRADSLNLSRAHFTTNSQAVPSLTVDSSCSGTRCTLTTNIGGQTLTETVSIEDLSFTETPTAVLTKYGITLVQSANALLAGYGAWLAHSGFAVQEEKGDASGVSYSGLYGIAGGDLTGSAPPTQVTATWRGLMVGGVVSNRQTVHGDALLTWADAGGGYGLSATFSDIKNLDTNAAHSSPSFSFTDLTVASDGTFGQGSAGTRVDGAFYGAGHAEVAGTLEHSGIVGAFGAKKQ